MYRVQSRLCQCVIIAQEFGCSLHGLCYACNMTSEAMIHIMELQVFTCIYINANLAITLHRLLFSYGVQCTCTYMCFQNRKSKPGLHADSEYDLPGA